MRVGGRRRAGKRRFLFMSTCPEPWGGSEELWWATAVELLARGHEVVVLKKKLDRGHPRIRALLKAGGKAHELDGFGGQESWNAGRVVLPKGRPGDFSRRQIYTAAGWLRARKPDAAVISQGGNVEGTHLGRLCARRGIEYSIIAQKASDFEWPDDKSRIPIAEGYARARYAIFVSDHNRRLTEDQLGIDLSNALIWPNPFLAGSDGPLPWPPAADVLRIACVGRLFPREKGQDILLRMLAEEEWRSRPVELEIYGKGVNRQTLVDMSERLGLENVRFCGHTSDVAAVWRRNHVLVLPSRSEGLPLVLVEAMLCGRVGVVTDVGGAGELVTDGLDGFIASAPTVERFAEAMERAWTRRDELEQVGLRAASAARAYVGEDDPGARLAHKLLEDASSLAES